MIREITRFGCVHFNPAAFKLGATHRSAPCGGQWQANLAWDLRRRTVCFDGNNFEFDFLLAAVATPILGMDFLAKFELSKFPSQTAGPARGLGSHLHQGKYHFF